MHVRCRWSSCLRSSTAVAQCPANFLDLYGADFIYNINFRDASGKRQAARGALVSYQIASVADLGTGVARMLCSRLLETIALTVDRS
jgi:hypothetical protein